MSYVFYIAHIILHFSTFFALFTAYCLLIFCKFWVWCTHTHTFHILHFLHMQHIVHICLHIFWHIYLHNLHFMQNVSFMQSMSVFVFSPLSMIHNIPIQITEGWQLYKSQFPHLLDEIKGLSESRQYYPVTRFQWFWRVWNGFKLQGNFFTNSCFWVGIR